MKVENLPVKSLKDREKFRAVPANYFDIERRIKRTLALLSSTKADPGVVRRYWRSRGITGAKPIEESLQWTFSPPFSPGRFNPARFPALYTSRDEETCIAEVQHYVDMMSGKREYVVFTVVANAEVRDLRRAVDDGTWSMPEEHTNCQPIGSSSQKLNDDGLIFYSMRSSHGSNCVFFSRTCIKAGDVTGMRTLLGKS